MLTGWVARGDRPFAFWALLALLGLLGVSGLAGGAQFVLDPSGGIVGISTAELAGSPFADYLVPGIVLFVVLGVAPLVVCYGLLRTRRWAWPAAIAVGLALAIWVLVEGLVIGFGERLQIPHFIQAVAIVVLATVPSVREYLGFSRE